MKKKKKLMVSLRYQGHTQLYKDLGEQGLQHLWCSKKLSTSRAEWLWKRTSQLRWIQIGEDPAFIKNKKYKIVVMLDEYNMDYIMYSYQV